MYLENFTPRNKYTFQDEERASYIVIFDRVKIF